MTTKETGVRTRTLEVVDVDLHAGRVLRIELIRSADGEPEEFHLAEAWSSGGTDRRRRVGPLPGSTLEPLRHALTGMLEEREA